MGIAMHHEEVVTMSAVRTPMPKKNVLMSVLQNVVMTECGESNKRKKKGTKKSRKVEKEITEMLSKRSHIRKGAHEKAHRLRPRLRTAFVGRKERQDKQRPGVLAPSAAENVGCKPIQI